MATQEMNSPLHTRQKKAKEILKRAYGDNQRDEKALLKDAFELRDLMEYQDLIKVCDLLLELNKNCFKAMELKALAMIRISPGKNENAKELLENALTLAHGSGEASALLGRLFKEMWRLSWFQNYGRLPLSRINNNIDKAYREIRYLQYATKQYIKAFAAKEDYYPGINMISLLSLEKYLLVNDSPDSQQKRYQLTLENLEEKVATLIDHALQHCVDDNRYWVLVSRAELKLIQAPDHSTGHDNHHHYVQSALADLDEALQLPSLKSFYVDSTMQQFRLFLELGFKPHAFLPALEKLEATWTHLEGQPINETPSAVETALKTPRWLNEFFTLLITTSNKEKANYWRDCQNNPQKNRVFSDLVLKWEPIEELTPRHSTRLIIGFELLGMDVCGNSYKTIIDRGETLGISENDLNLALMALGLRTVRLLRILMHNRQGKNTLNLYFSFNFDYQMMISDELQIILDHYLDPAISSSENREDQTRPEFPFFFEINENFPYTLKDKTKKIDSEKKQEEIDKACSALKTLLNTNILALVLDDSNEMDKYVQKNLKEMAYKTKADNKYTREIMEKSMPDLHASEALKELSTFAVEGKSYVIEGVEDNIQYTFLKNRWQHSETGLQGWRIEITPDLADFFEPLHETPHQPRGYRLKSWVDDHLGLH